MFERQAPVDVSTPSRDVEAQIETRVVPVVSAPAGTPPQRPRKPRIRVRTMLAALLGAAVLAGVVLYLVGFFLASEKLPKNATVSGVAVGGLNRQEAIDKVTEALQPSATRAIAYTVNGKPGEIKPAEAGLGIDVQASVSAAGGDRSFDPRQIWNVLTGGSAREVQVTVDEAELTAATKAIAATYDTEPVDATLRYRAAQVRTTPGVDGVTVQQDRAADTLESAFLVARSPVVLAAEVSEPEITTAEVAEVVRSFAGPAVAGPVEVSVGAAGTFDVTRSMIARSVSFTPEGGTLAPRLDPAALRKAADPAIEELNLEEPQDATVRLEDGEPQVVPATNGTTISADALAAAVGPVLPKAKGERAVTLELTGRPATFSTADAQKLGIKEVTGEFTTRFPYATYRNVNIGRAAQKINGTLLNPGETFSLNDIVGERTAANGFVEGNIIQGGKFKKELGGGVSQSATTTFNAAFFAGFEDVEHQPHSLFIDRYPVGREATVAWPSLDMRFKNDTKYGALVQAFTRDSTPDTPGSITVRIWSTKTYDKVEATEPRRSNFTTGRDLTDSGPDCQDQAPVQGFDVRYSRLFYRDGAVVERESFFWRYNPTDRIRCS